MDVQSKIYYPCCSASLLKMSAFISDLADSFSSAIGLFSWDKKRMFKPQLFEVESLYLNNVFLTTLISHVSVTLLNITAVLHQLAHCRAVCNLNVIKYYYDDKNILKTHLAGRFQVLAFLKKIEQKTWLRSEGEIPEDCEEKFGLVLLRKILDCW